MKSGISRESFAAVLAWIRDHPRCTSRDVSVGVFGHGDTRITERSNRSYASQLLRFMVVADLLVADQDSENDCLVYSLSPQRDGTGR
jgi:hypothetical protein